ncbi:hypothetical protein [Megasphaera massiliensis]|uniref:hypothetical protein n=2 Tax=Megasphaera massiliensis TaxID=1232428 RepID=UPI00041141CD
MLSACRSAATEVEFKDRLTHYGNHFWMLFDESDLTDDMYADASLHNDQGAWQMIFGVKYDFVLPPSGLCRKTDAGRH